MRPLVSTVCATLLLTVGACEEPRAFGEANSIVVGTQPELWNEVADTVQAVLEPPILTVRQERTFTLTHQDPGAEAWERLRLFRQLLLIGSGDEPWMSEALDELDEPAPTPPAIVQAQNVWARNQLVTLLLVPSGDEAEGVVSQLDRLHELMDQQYRTYARDRMFVSGRDTTLARRLEEEHGFELEVPLVYGTELQDSVLIFRNDNPDPSELIRQVTVTWRSPAPEELSDREVLAWREELAGEHYSYPQVHDTSRVARTTVSFGDVEARQIQAVWSNPPGDDFPAGGPFMVRTFECPDDDRLFMVDGWLYAPGQDKYEYMIQLETIMDSFRCA